MLGGPPGLGVAMWAGGIPKGPAKGPGVDALPRRVR
jgi:hypothetical protein